MLGYATDSTTRTYRLMKLTTLKVVKSRNVQCLNKMYGQYISKLGGIAANDEYDDLDNVSDEEQQSQGAIDSGRTEQEGKNKNT